MILRVVQSKTGRYPIPARPVLDFGDYSSADGITEHGCCAPIPGPLLGYWAVAGWQADDPALTHEAACRFGAVILCALVRLTDGHHTGKGRQPGRRRGELVFRPDPYCALPLPSSEAGSVLPVAFLNTWHIASGCGEGWPACFNGPLAACLLVEVGNAVLARDPDAWRTPGKGDAWAPMPVNLIDVFERFHAGRVPIEPPAPPPKPRRADPRQRSLF